MKYTDVKMKRGRDRWRMIEDAAVKDQPHRNAEGPRVTPSLCMSRSKTIASRVNQPL
jgi:hypothetical protein